MVNTEQFTVRFGYSPKQDDLERVNCPDQATEGHRNCGICSHCDRPRFECSFDRHDPALLINRYQITN